MDSICNLSNLRKRAVDNFLKEGYSCSESIVKAAIDEGLASVEMLDTATAFSGGMSCGCLCGAIAGAQMVLGQNHGRTKTGLAREKAKQFVEEFCKSHSCTCCRSLTKGMEFGSVQRKESCSKLVEECCKILERLV